MFVACSSTEPTPAELVASIERPQASGTFVDDVAVEFAGSFTPAQPASPVADLRWWSSTAGELHLATSADPPGQSRFSQLLPAGEHQISFAVTLADGQTSSDSVTITVEESGKAPEVQVLAPVATDRLLFDEPIELAGLVASEDFAPSDLTAAWIIADSEGVSTRLTVPSIEATGDITGEWTSGEPGEYNVSLQVTDPNGLVGQAAVEINVLGLDSIDRDDDGYTADVDCDDDDPSVNPGAVDLPDLEQLDTNCDGIDGNMAESIFLDSADGSDARSGEAPDQAVQTFERALDLVAGSSRDWILIRSGGGEPYVADLIDVPASMAGGYTSGFTSRNLSQPALFTPLRPEIGVIFGGLDERVIVQAIEIDTSLSPGLELTDHRIAAYVLKSTDVWFESSRIVAGAATSPDPGAPGESGEPGDPGEDGVSFTRSCPHGTDSVSSPYRGDRGEGVVRGGHGGEPGTNYNSDRHGTAGLAGAGTGAGAGGRAAGCSGFICYTASRGGDGDPGGNGRAGSESAPFGLVPDRLSDVLEHGYSSPRSGDGHAGTDGSGGGGGGGGGSGYRSCESVSVIVRGGGGGGGGGGGSAGTGGEGGVGGGVSIGLMVRESGVHLDSTTVISGRGADGSDGGAGGAGGAGGLAGEGGTSPGYLDYNFGNGAQGADGGDGGPGGAGGHGAGGVGGSSLAVWCLSSVDEVETSGSTRVISGTSGRGGRLGGAGTRASSGQQADMLGCE